MEGTSKTLFCRYALPQMAGLLLNSVYFIVDGLFIGNLLGRQAMAAAGVAVPVIELLIALSLGLSAGGGALISSCLGQGRRKEARELCSTVLLMAALCSAVLVFLGWSGTPWLAASLGAPDSLLPDAVVYLRTVLLFSPFLLFSFLLGGLARNDGSPRLAMWALSLGSVSNMVLDAVFMIPCGMGLFGAALATGIGPVISVLILLPHFLNRKNALCFRRLPLVCKEPLAVVVTGVPSFVSEFSIGLMAFFMNLAISRLPDAQLDLAAYLLMGYLQLIVLSLFLGMAEGLQPVFSWFAGARQQKKNLDLLRFGLRVFALSGLACGLLASTQSSFFYSLFAPSDPFLVQNAASHSMVYFAGTVCAALNILMTAYWQSVRQTRKALCLALLRSLIVPGVLISCVPGWLGPQWLWGCVPAAELLSLAAAGLLWRFPALQKEERVNEE